MVTAVDTSMRYCFHGMSPQPALCFCRSVVRECASFIDDILSSLLVAAKLAVPSTGSTDQQEANITETAQVPSDVAALQRQLSKAVGATRPSRTGALSQLADYLLAVCKQQQSQWPSAGAAADCWVPSADVLVNNLNILLFAQVRPSTWHILITAQVSISLLLMLWWQREGRRVMFVAM